MCVGGGSHTRAHMIFVFEACLVGSSYKSISAFVCKTCVWVYKKVHTDRGVRRNFLCQSRRCAPVVSGVCDL